MADAPLPRSHCLGTRLLLVESRRNKSHSSDSRRNEQPESSANCSRLPDRFSGVAHGQLATNVGRNPPHRRSSRPLLAPRPISVSATKRKKSKRSAPFLVGCRNLHRLAEMFLQKRQNSRTKIELLRL